ncbi:prepilin-type N-terminal cleavage/methylation domain-containing protein [Candidatus Margulisiibacteriota bacterium]
MKVLRNKGFTLIELLIVMGILALLMMIPILAFKGMQDEARSTKARGDLRTLKVAIETYYKNNGNEYPPENDLLSALQQASIQIVETDLYDPFGSTSTSPYGYKLATGDPSTAHYYVLYSKGPNGDGSALISNTGSVTASNDAIYDSNGYE